MTSRACGDLLIFVWVRALSPQAAMLAPKQVTFAFQNRACAWTWGDTYCAI